MNKETYTTWYEGLKQRLVEGEIDQKGFESLLMDYLQSLIVRVYNTRHDSGSMTREAYLEIINHYFELIADADISNQTALQLIRTVAGSIQKLPAAKVFAEKHNTPVPSPSEILGRRPGLLRKHAASTTDAMIGCPVITQVNKEGNEVTIELPWKTALHVYRGFLIKHLVAKHGYTFSDAYQCIDDHQNKYNGILAEILDSIISHKGSHLVSVGGGITAAGTGLVVSGVIKPEE